ncbi:hypothetical protein BACCIP111895_03508 [Neobacillus rhizosphaerae]|uniref:Uncharacterized protein n=1 Tax=Neobacillus rhizosphaerae TaxID=2880965 RepID=A0ABM9EUI1_9BACI|nr:hypothetical protein BACCIP111895_03508 [Neobacillus rhizosphaerae]
MIWLLLSLPGMIIIVLTIIYFVREFKSIKNKHSALFIDF